MSIINLIVLSNCVDIVILHFYIVLNAFMQNYAK